jgi:diguanylate cyclase (GGDEF)-like protein
LRLVRDGELFGLIDSLMAIGQVIHKGKAVDLKIAGALDEEVALAAATPANAPLLGSAVRKALDVIGQRELDRLIGQWHAAQMRRPVDYGRLWELSLVASVLLLLLLAWNRSLMRSNRALADAQRALAEKSAMLERMSITDALTGVANRRRLDQARDAEVHRCERGAEPFSLLMFDLDRFKRVNDRYGHLVGDAVLKAFAQRLTALSRKPDLLGRWGGEEFLLLCPNTSAAAAARLAERLRVEVSAVPFEQVGRCTCSIGVATFVDGDDANAVLRRADRALYLAKAGGRNQVVLLSPADEAALASEGGADLSILQKEML